MDETDPDDRRRTGRRAAPLPARIALTGTAACAAAALMRLDGLVALASCMTVFLTGTTTVLGAASRMLGPILDPAVTGRRRGVGWRAGRNALPRKGRTEHDDRGATVTETTTEKRSFNMHKNLLFDVITKQAGSLSKAVLEGVMNGVDAGATRIEVNLDATSFSIRDDGKGFVDRQEIEDFFETFGTPHQEGDATYGRYRMGRGQILAYGRNSWRSNQFRMDVDIKNEGLDYHLRTVPETERGCTIEVELYNPLLPSEREALERDIRRQVAWVSVPVVFNGRTISTPPAEGKWTVETDDAWFKLSTTATSLTIYNLGVLVMDQPAYHHGIGGIVVSKERLDVNFARNDVQSTCPVFRRIRTELRKHADRETTTKRKLSDSERQHVALRIVSDDIGWKEASSAPVLTDIEGKHISIEKFRTRLWQTRDLLVAARGDRVAVKVAQQGLAIALASETLQRFDVPDADALVAALTLFAERHSDPSEPSHWQARSFRDSLATVRTKTVDDYAGIISTRFETLRPKDITANRRVLLQACAKGANSISGALGKRAYRRILPGRSEIAQAWTDGENAIWIDEKHLATLSGGYQGCVRMAGLLLHEYLHDGPDTETHDHDAEFYERFHDAALDSDVVGRAATIMMRYMAERARRDARTPNAHILRFEDDEETLVRIGAAGSPPVEPGDPDEGGEDSEDAPVIGRAA